MEGMTAKLGLESVLHSDIMEIYVVAKLKHNFSLCSRSKQLLYNV